MRDSWLLSGDFRVSLVLWDVLGLAAGLPAAADASAGVSCFVWGLEGCGCDMVSCFLLILVRRMLLRSPVRSARISSGLDGVTLPGPRRASLRSSSLTLKTSFSPSALPDSSSPS